MGTTTNYALPWPEDNESQRLFPDQAKTLAEKVDTELKNLNTKNSQQNTELTNQGNKINQQGNRLTTAETTLTEHTDQIGTLDGGISDLTEALDLLDQNKITGTGMTLRHDTTVGTRVFLDHPGGTLMLYGDTGWRDITDSLINGWTAMRIVIHRVMDRVYLEVLGLNGTSATLNEFITLPAGWSLGTSFGRQIQIGDKTAAYRTGGRSLVLPKGETYFNIGYELAEFTTPDAWPSAQAGTPYTYR